MDRHDLYERCVQSPDHRARLLSSIHGAAPNVLGEDFCGTASVARAWIATGPGKRAIAVDHDPEVLRRVVPAPGLEVVEGDVRSATDPAQHAADVIYAGNFSIGQWHKRGALVDYLQHTRRRLTPGGTFVCDLYGGETAYLLGVTVRDTPLPDGRVVRYQWEQREADPLTGRVVNAMHFDVLRDESVEATLTDAFVYDWRLWGVAELRDAMTDAGFAETAVHHGEPDAIDDEGQVYTRPIEDPDDLEDSFVVLLVGRAR